MVTRDGQQSPHPPPFMLPASSHLFTTDNRFIPTRAGNTFSAATLEPVISVHPHASGEHSPLTKARRGRTGSSPREWGTLHALIFADVVVRFIPTRVGNTRLADFHNPPQSVHPHASGEHLRHRGTYQRFFGSSPREWGTRCGACYGLRGIRFIPTRVGNTARGVGAGGGYAVHPHASGEHAIALGTFGKQHGSSPREWGTRVPRQH